MENWNISIYQHTPSNAGQAGSVPWGQVSTGWSLHPLQYQHRHCRGVFVLLLVWLELCVTKEDFLSSFELAPSYLEVNLDVGMKEK